MKNMIWLDPKNPGKYAGKLIRFLINGLISTLIIHFFAVQSSAEDVTLQWNTNPEASYYIVYYGTASKTYTNESDFIYAPTAQTTLSLANDTTWYLAVKAFNDCGNSSDYSDEITHTTASSPEPDPLSASIESPVVNASIYQGDSINFLGSVTGGTPAYTYSWNFGNSGVSTQNVEDPGNMTFSSTGTFQVTFSVIDADGSSSSDSVQVTVLPADTQPVAEISSPASDTTITAGTSVTFAGSYSGGNGICTHAWNFGTDGPDGQNVEDPGAVIFSQEGIYEVTYTVTDSDNDTGSDTVVITVEAAYVDLNPTATITSPASAVTITAGQSVTFAGSFTQGNGSTTHYWNFGTGGPSDQTVQNPGAVLFNTAGSYTVTYTVTDGDSDSASDSVDITVESAYVAPSATITSPAAAMTITEGESVTFAAEFTHGIAPYSHDWTFGGNGPSGQSVEDPGAVTFTQAGTFTVVYTVTDGQNEYDSDMVVITVESAPVDAGDTTADSGTTNDDSATSDSSTVGLTPVLTADVDGPVSEIQWQISTDIDFKDVVLNVKVKDSTILRVPELVLNAGVEYFWRYRNKTPKAVDNSWTDSQTFLTEAATWNDNDGDGVPDDQEAPAGLDLNMDGVYDETQPDTIRCIKTNLSGSVIGLVKTDGVVDIELLESIDYTAITDTVNMPDSMPSGMIGFRIVVDEVGASVGVGICFNEPIPEGAIWYKYDSVNGWQDYTAHTVISDDRMMITVSLTDGGLGDSDGSANGVIVDPAGIGLNYSTVSNSTLGMPATEDGCFIGSSSGASTGAWPWIVIPMIACGLTGMIRKERHNVK